jgi:glutamyl-tRNA synthetase
MVYRLTLVRSLLVAGKELRDRVKFLLRLDRQNYTTPREFFDRHAPCFCHVSRPPYVPRADIAGSTLTTNHVQLISGRLGQITVGEWSSHKLEEAMADLACDVGGIERRNLGADDVQAEFKSIGNALGRFLRWALTGGQPGPGIRTVMIILGQEVTLQRLREAKVDVENSSSNDDAHKNEVAAAG